MSSLNNLIRKKLQPARKAWKSFTTKIQKNLHKLNKKPKNKRLHAVLRLSRSLVPPRLPRIKKRSPNSSLHLKRQRHNTPHDRYPPVYIDELFTDATHVKLQVKQAKTFEEAVTLLSYKELERKGEILKPRIENDGDVIIINGAKKKVSDVLGPSTSSSSSSSSALLLKLRGVDERAEEFIAKFREEMRLQREESYGEFQEMLARGL